MLAVDTQTLMSNATQPPKETASIGNKAAARSQIVLTSDNAVATFVGIRWDGDKVRGIRIELSDGSLNRQAGMTTDNTRSPSIASPRAKR